MVPGWGWGHEYLVPPHCHTGLCSLEPWPLSLILSSVLPAIVRQDREDILENVSGLEMGTVPVLGKVLG